MTKTQATVNLENALAERCRSHGEYGCTEVTIGFKHEGHGDEIVDFMSMSADGMCRCYELKVTLSDLRSDNRLSWYGDYNYLVVSDSLYLRRSAFENDIPPYVGILSGTELTVRRNARQKKVSEETRRMLKDSLLRSMYGRMVQYRDAGDPEVIKRAEKEIQDLKDRLAELDRETDRVRWTYQDYETWYRRNHQNSGFSLEQGAKEERKEYAMRMKGEMTWQNNTCPVCGHTALKDETGEYVLSDFCPFCGADLRKFQH